MCYGVKLIVWFHLIGQRTSQVTSTLNTNEQQRGTTWKGTCNTTKTQDKSTKSVQPANEDVLSTGQQTSEQSRHSINENWNENTAERIWREPSNNTSVSDTKTIKITNKLSNRTTCRQRKRSSRTQRKQSGCELLYDKPQNQSTKSPEAANQVGLWGQIEKDSQHF